MIDEKDLAVLPDELISLVLLFLFDPYRDPW